MFWELGTHLLLSKVADQERGQDIGRRAARAPGRAGAWRGGSIQRLLLGQQEQDHRDLQLPGALEPHEVWQAGAGRSRLGETRAFL